MKLLPFIPRLLRLLPLVALVSCGQPSAPDTQPPASQPPAHQDQNRPDPTSQTQSKDADSRATQKGEVGNVSEGLQLSFGGIRALDQVSEYKIFDLEQNAEAWVKQGADYRGYQVVGLYPGQDTLVLEQDGFWYLYPLVGKSDAAPRERVKILDAKDIPEGVAMMDYILENTIPLNDGVMPEDDTPLNVGIVMPGD